MKITEMRSWDLLIPYAEPFRPSWQPGVVRKDREFTLVAVTVEDGTVGYAGVDQFRSSEVKRYVEPYLLGESVYDVEHHAETLRNAGFCWFIDMALWDIIGKLTNKPIHEIWGRVRDSVPAYASTGARGNPDERAELIRHYRDQGFKFAKFRFGNEDLKDDLAIYDAVHAAAPELGLMIDANQATNLPRKDHPLRWDLNRALQTARELHDRGCLWLEEPLPRYNVEDLVRLRECSDIHIAGGEKNRGLHEFQVLINAGAYDIIQPDPAMSEGMSQLRKIAAASEMWNRHFIPHHGLSGLGLAASLQLCLTTPGLKYLEMMYEPPTRTLETYQQLGGIITSTIWIDDDGLVHGCEEPGLGVSIDESKIDQYVVRS
ncbi:mandelate racemase/muconate lactonizing enzyme family protein [Brevibacterium sp. SMBL_HHYL_HB1]|uniref:mandelate racemase/muconate lactonizing enzyme family protein n=1 Tax=Brevibacterium sp. SMBL_HHYL_HB1 TaxID=2777556 RepID=UPI001BA54EC7|nr:mandelate racemase/muconate lactonizing enzyme family protein [Brevibacterium sp. SMBL_HHYL_HB1]QUL80659.1 mandelate racemase/muconate lactonizing enzyme family protein [Brevibacterium sp. SMBL_HHYL_HB1]